MRKLVLTTSADGDAAFVTDLLIEYGALSTSVKDRYAGTNLEQQIEVEQADGIVYDVDGRGVGELWRESVIEAWLPSNIDAEGVAMSIAVATDTNFRQVRVEPYVENDDNNQWIDEMRKYVNPVVVGSTRISYVSDEESQMTPGNVNIVLDVGAAFGTGHHATTQLCLRWLDSNLPKESPTKLLDFGCGSGVLALRAALQNERTVAVGVDTDESAIVEARKNALRNCVQDQCTFVSDTQDIKMQMFDIVVANILAVTLIKLAPRVVAQLRVGGKIALSGMLASQAVGVCECYEKLGVRLKEGEVQSEWTILSGTKVW